MAAWLKTIGGINSAKKATWQPCAAPVANESWIDLKEDTSQS
jgi:hypothetical protein